MGPAVIRILHRLAQLYWRVVQPVSVGVKGIVIYEGKTLLVRHTYGRRKWDLPGGHVKRRETVEEAVIREMHEECGVVARVRALHGVFYHTNNYKHDHIFVFLCEPEVIGPVPRSAEIAQVAFFDVRNLPEMSAGARSRLDEVAAGDRRPILGTWGEPPG